MSGKQLSLFDLLEDKKDRYAFTLPQQWTIQQLCQRYYQFKLTDGCSVCFLDSVKRHLKYFTVWLKKYGCDPAVERLSDLNSAILSDFRQMLADNSKISAATANLYINHIRMFLFWAENIHGLSHPPMGVIRKFRKYKVKKGHGREQNRSAISWEELEKLFAAAGVVDTVLLLLGLNCGFGNTDIGTLKLCDIDLEAATVSHPRPKTGVERHLILWPETVAILKTYINIYRGKPVNEEVGRLVFVGKRGNPFCWDY
jgi:integrase